MGELALLVKLDDVLLPLVEDALGRLLHGALELHQDTRGIWKKVCVKGRLCAKLVG